MSALFGFVPAFGLAAVLLFVVLRAAQRAAAAEAARGDVAKAERVEQARFDAQFNAIVSASLADLEHKEET